MIPILRILRGGARRGIFGEGPVKKIPCTIEIKKFESRIFAKPEDKNDFLYQQLME